MFARYATRLAAQRLRRECDGKLQIGNEAASPPTMKDDNLVSDAFCLMKLSVNSTMSAKCETGSDDGAAFSCGALGRTAQLMQLNLSQETIRNCPIVGRV